MKSLNPRQERFCQSFVLCPNASYAARDAGFESKWARKQGSRLMATTRIRARIREIQVEMARDHGLGRDALIGKLEVVYRRAGENHHFTAAVRAVEAQARLGGKSIQGIPLIEQEKAPAELKTGTISVPIPVSIPVKNVDLCGPMRTVADISPGFSITPVPPGKSGKP